MVGDDMRVHVLSPCPALEQGGKVAKRVFSLLFQVGFTSAPGQGGILAQRDFDRRFSPHFVSTFHLIMEKCTTAAAAQCGGFCLHVVCVACPAVTWRAPAGAGVNSCQFSRGVSRKQLSFHPSSLCEGAALWDLSQKI